MSNPHKFPDGIGYAAYHKTPLAQAGLALTHCWTFNQRNDGHTYTPQVFGYNDHGGPAYWGITDGEGAFLVVDWTNGELVHRALCPEDYAHLQHMGGR